MRPLVIYHGACRDGFCAAWVAWKRLPGSDFHAAQYGTEPPDVKGRIVYVVDFSYSREVMLQMQTDAEWMVVLDHHKTAQAALEGLAFARFDMNRSGAGMTWDYLFADKARPWLVDYVEDRDLWRFKHPESETINAWISTLAFEFESWDRAHMDMVQDAMEVGDHLRGARVKGRAVEAKVKQYVAEVARNARRVVFEGCNVPLVNAPQVDVSELGSHLAQGEPFAMAWWQRADGVFQYSMRSREPSDIDVSEIAKRHGGGGHQRAAGFQSKEMLFT